MKLGVPHQRPFLVDDVVAIIVEQLALDCGPKDLAALALVSSAWLRPTRCALYASPRLLSYHSCRLLSRTLFDNPSLGDRIRALHLCPVSHECSSGNTCSCRDVNIFALSLSPLFRIPNLQEVSLGGDCAFRAEQYLKCIIFPKTIRKLRVEGMQWFWSFEVNRPVVATLRWSEGLASRFPNLRVLELVNLDLSICARQAFKPRPPRIETLFMDRVRITGGKLSNLACNAWSNLKELTIIVSGITPKEYDVRNILSQAFKSLQVFKYLIKENDDLSGDLQTAVVLDALASCSSLRDLQVSLSFGYSTLKTLRDRLERLEVLKVHSNYEIDIEEWAVEISMGIFPSLREMHLPIGYEMRRIADFQWSALRLGTMQRACAARGISLNYTY